MTKNPIQNGMNYEKKVAKRHGATHVGGPGKVDYTRGETKGEVKARVTKVTKPELQKLITDKGVNQVDSKSGFTKPALEYRDRYHPEVKLFHKTKRV